MSFNTISHQTQARQLGPMGYNQLITGRITFVQDSPSWRCELTARAKNKLMTTEIQIAHSDLLATCW